MSSKIPVNQQRVVIIGAGISGLALGWYLQKRYGEKISLTILESDTRPGGWIRTQHQDGFLFEQGPRSCRSYGAGIQTLRLIEELGLQEELIFASSAAHRRYLYTNQRLTCLPSSVGTLFYSPFALPLIKALWSDWRAAKAADDRDESIAEFISRRLGKEAAELFFDPLVCGIYAGDIHKLSMKSCFPLLHEWEARHGWLLGGALSKKSSAQPINSPFVQDAQKKGLFTLQNGMASLIDTLAKKLKPSLKLDCKVTSLGFSDSEAIVSLVSGESIQANRLYLAIPPQALEALISPHRPCVAKALKNIPSASVGIVNLGYRKQQLTHQGFGYLIPTREKEPLLGVVWDSSAFPSQNKTQHETRLTAMIGDAYLPMGQENAEGIIANIALTGIAKHLGLHTLPNSVSATIAYNAIPQYTIGHADRLAVIQSGLQDLPVPVEILGNGYYGVAVNDCIAKAKELAEGYSDA